MRFWRANMYELFLNTFIYKQLHEDSGELFSYLA